jgi:signal transduction histidine kinase
MMTLKADPQGSRNARRRSVVLIVDDQLANRMLLGAMLSPQGYDIVEASSGEEALEILADQDVDVVLLDLVMPGMDGVETCREIRADRTLIHLPIVMVSALDDRSARIDGKRAGVDEFLNKPVDETELLARVSVLLRAKLYHDLREERAQDLRLQVESAREQLRRADRLATVGTLAGGVGHELNNVAGVAVMALGMIELATEKNQVAAAEDLEGLRFVVNHLKHHADQLLQLVRPSRDDEREDSDAVEVVGSVTRMLALSGVTKHLNVETKLPDNEVPVTLPPTELEQVLINIITNAAHAIEGAPGGRIVVALSDEDDGVSCIIEDNGTGIAPEHLDQVFEPYFTTKPASMGTGLGLPVVRSIVEEAGGTCVLRSVVGQGTRFELSLPRASRRSQVRPLNSEVGDEVR